MFVSGNSTKSSKTPRPYGFYWILKKIFLKWRKISKKLIFSPIFEEEKNKQKTEQTYFFFRPYPTDIF